MVPYPLQRQGKPGQRMGARRAGNPQQQMQQQQQQHQLTQRNANSHGYRYISNGRNEPSIIPQGFMGQMMSFPSGDSVIIELLDLKHDVGDNGSVAWFLQDLATEQNAEGTTIIEQSGVFTADGIQYRNSTAIMTTAVGEMKISKGRQGPEAQNHVKVYVANLRFKEVRTDVLITAYEPFMINPLSECATSVPVAQSGCTPMSEVHDWNLFTA